MRLEKILTEDEFPTLKDKFNSIQDTIRYKNLDTAQLYALKDFMKKYHSKYSLENNNTSSMTEYMQEATRTYDSLEKIIKTKENTNNLIEKPLLNIIKGYAHGNYKWIKRCETIKNYLDAYEVNEKTYEYIKKFVISKIDNKNEATTHQMKDLISYLDNKIENLLQKTTQETINHRSNDTLNKIPEIENMYTFNDLYSYTQKMYAKINKQYLWKCQKLVDNFNTIINNPLLNRNTKLSLITQIYNTTSAHYLPKPKKIGINHTKIKTSKENRFKKIFNFFKINPRNTTKNYYYNKQI